VFICEDYHDEKTFICEVTELIFQNKSKSNGKILLGLCRG